MTVNEVKGLLYTTMYSTQNIDNTLQMLGNNVEHR